jgi:hypothetical protein
MYRSQKMPSVNSLPALDGVFDVFLMACSTSKVKNYLLDITTAFGTL